MCRIVHSMIQLTTDPEPSTQPTMVEPADGNRGILGSNCTIHTRHKIFKILSGTIVTLTFFGFSLYSISFFIISIFYVHCQLIYCFFDGNISFFSCFTIIITFFFFLVFNSLTGIAFFVFSPQICKISCTCFLMYSINIKAQPLLLYSCVSFSFTSLLELLYVRYMLDFSL